MDCELGLHKICPIEAVQAIGSHDSPLGQNHLIGCEILSIELEVLIDLPNLPYQNIRLIESLVFAGFMKVEVLVSDALQALLFY